MKSDKDLQKEFSTEEIADFTMIPEKVVGQNG